MQADRFQRLLRAAANFGLATGIVSALVTLFSSWLGLGVREAFPTYAWFGIGRRQVFLASLGVAGTGAALHLFALWFADRRRVISLAINTALVLASTAACLLTMEIGARVIDGVPVFALRNWLAERNALLTTQTANVYHPVLGWVLRPNQSVQPGSPDNSFTTGKLGERLNTPGAPQPTRGAIVAVGDSFTAGSEVGDRHSWPAQLERMLARQVINAAAGAWGSDQIVLRAESLIPLLAPSAIVVSFLDDDIMRAGFRVYGSGNKSWFTIEGGKLVHHGVPVPVYKGTLAETPGYLMIPSYSYLALWTIDRTELAGWLQRTGVSYVRVDNDPVEVSCLLLARLKRTADEKGIRLLFVMQYSGYVNHASLRPQSYSDRVLACARGAGIESVDLWDDLATVNRRSFDEYVKLWVSFDGRHAFGHMSSAGNRLVAERIAARLAENPR